MSRLAPLVLFLSVAAVAAAAPDGDALAQVNGQKLTARDFESYLAIRGLPAELSPTLRERLLTELIDRELIRQFLERRKSEPDPEQLAAAVRAAKERLADGAEDQEAALQALGTDVAHLRAEMALSLNWRRHVRRVVTENRLRSHFAEHRRRLDGSRVRVSQIFLKYESGESAQKAPQTTARLTSIRNDIAEGERSFADAAQAISQSPSAAQGGDMGWVSPQGDLPEALSMSAFSLEPDAMSDVILTPFGAHLITVTDVKPGDLSLEDARPAILEELSRQIWDETVAAERKTAKIER